MINMRPWGCLATIIVLAGCGPSGPTRWGYIDRAGTFKIKPQFIRASEFTEGLAAVEVDRKWGFINTAGEFVIPPRFGSALPFSEGLAAVTTASSKDVWSPNTRFGFIDKAGDFVIPEKFDLVASFSEGLAEVCIGACRGREYERQTIGFIDRTGEFVLKQQFTESGPFSEGLAEASLEPRSVASLERRSVTHIPRTGYISRSGDFVIAPSFILTSPFSNGLAATSRGYIDKTGKLVIRVPQGAYAEAFSDGLGRVRTESGDSWFYDTSGAVVLRFHWARDFSEGLAVAGTQQMFQAPRYGYINKSGQFVLKPQFGDAQKFSNGLAAVCPGCEAD